MLDFFIRNINLNISAATILGVILLIVKFFSKKAVDWNKEAFDAMKEVNKEIKKENPDPFVLSMGRMVLFKGMSVEPKEFERLVKMRYPFQAIDLFSKSYEVIKFSSGYFEWKYQLFCIGITLYILMNILSVVNFVLYFDSGRIIFLFLTMIALSAIIVNNEFNLRRRGREFLKMQKEDFLMSPEETNLNTSPDTPITENHQTNWAKMSAQEKNAVSNNICIRVSL